MCACANNHPSTCALLLSHGADLGASNDRGMTALHIAAFLGSLSIIHETIEYVARRRRRHDPTRSQPRRPAESNGPCSKRASKVHTEIALCFLDAGADAYHLDDEQQTCLHATLSAGVIFARHIRLFYRLIEFVDYRSHQGRSRTNTSRSGIVVPVDFHCLPTDLARLHA